MDDGGETQAKELIEKIIGLAVEIEVVIMQRIQTATSGGAKMFWENTLLLGPTSENEKSILSSTLRAKGIPFTETEFLMAALMVRERSLKARGLR